MAVQDTRPVALGQALQPNIWDIVALILVTGAMVLIVYGGEQTTAPLSALDVSPVTLDPGNLPFYALRTTMRMLLAIICSIIFTFIYAALAAKSRRAEMVLIPLLDILQSVPILGFLTFTVLFFMNLFPGRVLGAELACVFAIFTSQAWNMTFSMYQSMRNVPKDLEDATQSFHLSGWQHFWRLDVPFAMPGLIWNAMMSMSGGWFFVVASEAITVGNTTVTLPGVGSYVALAIQKRDLPAIGYAILTMLLVIIVYDQLLFRPVVAWADKFRFEQTASGNAPTSWMLDLFRRTRALRALSIPFTALNKIVSNLHIRIPGLSLVPATVDLSGAELELADMARRNFILKDALDEYSVRGENAFSYILIDCPPSLTLLTLNAMAAADAVMVPLQCEFFALEGLSQLMKTIELVRDKLNPALEIQGIVLTMFDKRNKLSDQVADDVRATLGEKVYSTVIPRNVRVSEAPSHGVPALVYDLRCPGSQAYIKLAGELIQRERVRTAA